MHARNYVISNPWIYWLKETMTTTFKSARFWIETGCVERRHNKFSREQSRDEPGCIKTRAWLTINPALVQECFLSCKSSEKNSPQISYSIFYWLYESNGHLVDLTTGISILSTIQVLKPKQTYTAYVLREQRLLWEKRMVLSEVLSDVRNYDDVLKFRCKSIRNSREPRRWLYIIQIFRVDSIFSSCNSSCLN